MKNEKTKEVKDAILYAINEAIRFRLTKAEEYPEDDRNEHSVDLLESFAEEVTEANDDHPVFRELLAISDNNPEVFKNLGPSHRSLDRMGFMGGPDNLSLEGLPGYAFAGAVEAYEQSGWNELLKWLFEIVDSEDVPPSIRLSALGHIRETIERKTRFKEKTIVKEARKEGLSWSDIGRPLGLSKQTVWKRYAEPDEIPADKIPEH